VTVVLTTLAALGFGLVSALVPVVNAEAYAITAGAVHPAGLVLVVIALAVGQTAGKVVIFEAARSGSGRLVRRRQGKVAASRWASWSDRLRVALTGRRAGPALVFASASVGVPPLLAVSLAAGAAGQRRCWFALTCLAGRTLRFGLLALPLAFVLRP